MTQIKILHIISGLGNGGAEKNLFKIVTCTNKEQFKHVVVSLKDYGYYGDDLIRNNIQVYTLNINKSIFNLLHLFKIIRENDPEIIQTWMYHANFLGGVVAKLLKKNNIIWSVRSTKAHGAIIKIINFFNIPLSYFLPKKILYCSNAAMEYKASIGYDKNKAIVIHNGYDILRYRFREYQRKQLRKHYNIEDNCIILGNFSRYNKVKDQIGLLKALKLTVAINKNIKLFIIGNSVDTNNKFNRFIKNNQLNNFVTLLPSVKEIENYYSLIDIYVLSSIDESCPNVLAEAMASSAICVSTNVGDAKYIIGDYGYIVRKKDYKAMSNEILKAINLNHLEKEQLKIDARNRIANTFPMATMIKNYELMYKKIMGLETCVV